MSKKHKKNRLNKSGNNSLHKQETVNEPGIKETDSLGTETKDGAVKEAADSIGRETKDGAVKEAAEQSMTAKMVVHTDDMSGRHLNERVIYATSADASDTQIGKVLRKKLRYTVLFVPNNNRRVLQFHVSFDFMLFMMMLFLVLLVGFVFYISGTGRRLQDARENLLRVQNELLSKTDENVLLQAQIEDLQKDLKDVQDSLVIQSSKVEAEEKQHYEDSKPSVLPLEDVATMPAEYKEKDGDMKFNVGEGTKVIATADGIVEEAAINVEEGGYIVRINHQNGYVSVYKVSTNAPIVKEGIKVIRGTALYVTDCADVLKYQILFNDVYINPVTLMDISG